jgi:hypothetical protein
VCVCVCARALVCVCVCVFVCEMHSVDLKSGQNDNIWNKS